MKEGKVTISRKRFLQTLPAGVGVFLISKEGEPSKKALISPLGTEAEEAQGFQLDPVTRRVEPDILLWEGEEYHIVDWQWTTTGPVEELFDQGKAFGRIEGVLMKEITIHAVTR